MKKKKKQEETRLVTDTRTLKEASAEVGHSLWKEIKAPQRSTYILVQPATAADMETVAKKKKKKKAPRTRERPTTCNTLCGTATDWWYRKCPSGPKPSGPTLLALSLSIVFSEIPFWFCVLQNAAAGNPWFELTMPTKHLPHHWRMNLWMDGWMDGRIDRWMTDDGQ